MDLGEHAETTRSGGAARTFISIVIMVALVIAITILLRLFVFIPYEIPSGSMEDTIRTGDMVFSEKISYYMRSPEYGDIVTFKDPEVAGRVLIKRVIATEGQTVDLVNGKVVVDGEVLDEPYVEGRASYELNHYAPGVQPISYPFVVPEGHLWLMGDNRTNSLDSRYYGAIPVSSLIGRAFCTYWPLNHARLL